MANNELAIRFTETKYSTRSEVSRELKMSLIDNIWSNILSYRSSYNRYLTIKSIDKNQLVICYCSSISALVNAVDMKLIRLLKEQTKISQNNSDALLFETEAYVKCLKSLAEEYSLDASENYLRSLVRGDIKEVSASHKILVQYLNALRYVQKRYVNNIDEDFLADLYSVLTGNNELTSFYRTKEDLNHENRVLIDRIYTCAPVMNIEPMMDSLFSFIANSNLTSTVKACIAYYYIVYIKPFSTFSDEIALLVAKSILAHFNLGELGAFIPLETLLSQGQEEIAKLFVEVQKTNDTTYFVNYMLNLIDKKGDELLDNIASINAHIFKQDLYQLDAEPVKEVLEEEVEKENVEVHKEKVNEPEEKVEEVKEEINPQNIVIKEEIKEQIAVSYIPPAIDEKEAYRLEQHLLELDPSLRKGEAHFYARHCTLGKSYTIAQYKKMIGCVYETARTAMDHLVQLGYYRKDSSNKKFIYTPIPRK